MGESMTYVSGDRLVHRPSFPTSPAWSYSIMPTGSRLITTSPGRSTRRVWEFYCRGHPSRSCSLIEASISLFNNGHKEQVNRHGYKDRAQIKEAIQRELEKGRTRRSGCSTIDPSSFDEADNTVPFWV